MSGPLAERAAVVTGAGRGIGAAIARSLAAAGARLVIVARTERQVNGVAEELSGSGAKAFSCSCDVSREADVRRLGRFAREKLGAVDILVNNAGASSSAPLRKIELEDWNGMLGANATSTFLCTREFAPAMVARGFGRVVNVASIAGLEGARYVSHYCAAKHAVVGFSRALAAEMAGTGVTVNAVCPGYVDTAMTERTLENARSRGGMGRDEALAAVLATTRQSRLVTPEEVAALVLEFCCEAASARSGEAIVVRPAEDGE